MTKEEIAKLKELQRELLTQKPDGTRDPRLFVIMEPHYTVGPEGYDATNYIIYDDGEELISDSYSKGNFKYSIEEIIEHYDFDEEVASKLRACKTVEQVWDVIADYSDDLTLMPLEKTIYPSYDTVFFTRKAAKEYLKTNGHHHPEGSYTYSTYPDRCEDWQLVGKLLRELDFDKLEAE